MLSYQHIYHAGNLADVHKHALLAWMLGYLTTKDKPLTYIETHGGRALYNLTDAAARKTAEADKGITKCRDWFSDTDPYGQVLSAVAKQDGPDSYPGSPMIAAHLLRPTDSIHLAELHPKEHAALTLAMSPYSAKIYQRDGFEMAHALTPPMPRRGLMLIDPSFEVKEDYNTIPAHVAKIARAWNVGIIALWYPILTSNAHAPMLSRLDADHPEALRHEVRFAPARPGHGMVGSGLFVINPPYGLAEAAKDLGQKFKKL